MPKASLKTAETQSKASTACTNEKNLLTQHSAEGKVRRKINHKLKKVIKAPKIKDD